MASENVELNDMPIANFEELEFVIFCIENMAISLKISAERVYKAFTQDSNILSGYIVPCYDVLHSQGKEYIIEDLKRVMKSKGVCL